MISASIPGISRITSPGCPAPKRGGILPRYVFCILPPLFTVSCVKKEFDQRVTAQITSVADQTKEIANLIDSPGSYPVQWKTALKLLEERNLNLKRSRDRAEDILRERNEQWKDWIPRPSVYGNLNSSLTELGNLSLSDFNAALVAPLSIPNPLTERARAFENALSYLESKDSMEVTYRREVISLYQIYSRMSKLEENRTSSLEGDVKSVSNALGQLDAKASNSAAVEALQSQLIQILNLPGSKPLPVSSSRPNIDYEGKFRKFVPGRNYGMLAVRLSAYRIEGALLREKGIKLRKWPNLSLSSSIPALYDTQGNRDFTDTGQIALFGGLTKSYDLAGADVDSVKSAKENTEFVKQNLRLQLDRDTRQWNRLQQQYEGLMIKKKIATERLAKIRKGSPVASAAVDLLVVREATGALAQLEQLKEQLDLEIWTWDDSAWK